ncbi:hypothetical protein [Pseudotamlana carrageenivorans]|uniref:Uncharacterized protein n=1 Tax=Pseudotamlana carrageenivorans TaxID=2069432 RepID=A0A2I7SLE2_9FLAO|nr:hypothetical protein [Tamlana carrageenivorans]AUS06721.1 hypothetical protein C1A40_15285 [Tamlana carrageenivorans]
MKNKYYIYILFLLIIFTSCGTYHPQNKFNYYNGSTFYNDSLNMSVNFFGDTKIDNPKKEQKKIIKLAIKDLKGIKLKNLMVFGFCSDPEYNIFLFYKEPKKAITKIKDSIKLIVKDTVNNRILFKKKNTEIYLLLKGKNKLKGLKHILKDGFALTESILLDSANSEKLTFSKIFETYKNNPNYLFVREKLKNTFIPKSKKKDWMQFQYLATVNSFMSNNIEYDSLINEFQSSRKKYLQRTVDSIISKRNAIINDAVFDSISEASSRTNVVMLNEMHWEPNHRVVANKLLKILNNKGYKYLAIEAVYKNRDSSLNFRGYPIKNDGYYTREPYFGQFIREALDLGFKIVSYDDFETNNREETQAKNIKKIIEKDSTAKIFVYAGIAHINEKETVKGKRMAAYFKELTNTDPLTINQVDIVSDIKNDLLLIKSDNFKSKKKIDTNVDYFLMNNTTPILDSIFDNKELTNISLKKNIFNEYINEELLISVYYQEEYEKYKSGSIPIINRIIHIKNNKITIRVPVSKLTIKIKDKNDNTILIEKIESK